VIRTKSLILAFFVLLALAGHSQSNLVSNGGLETFSTCPNTLSQLTLATGWGQATLHVGSPDYFNSCQTNTTAGVPTNTFGSTGANQGNAYAGGYTYLNYGGSLATYREYVVATLTSALVAGQSYVVSFQYARATNTRYASDAYGFYLSSAWPSNGTSGNGALPVTPTSLNPTGNFLSATSWSTYSDTIVAAGGEQYLTIGSFTQNASGTLVSSTGINGAYMYVDDAQIIIYNGIFGDSNICLGDSALIYGILDTTHYWVDSANPNVNLGTNDTLIVAPTQTTTYWAITYNDTFAFTVGVHNPPAQFVGNDTVLCEGDTMMRLVNLPGYDLLWSDSETDSALFSVDSGYHWLEISIYTCTKRDSFHVTFHEFPEFDLVEDTTICDYDNYFLSTGLSSPLLFNWSTGGTAAGISIVDSGIYSVTVTNENCAFSDSSYFSYYPEITLDLGQDKDFCYTPSSFITPSVVNANQFNWSNNASSDSIQVNTSGLYFLTVSNNGICEAVDSVQYNFYHEPTVNFTDDTAFFCDGDKVELLPQVVSGLPVDYAWSTTDNNTSIFTNQIGLFWVEVSNEHCAQRDSIIVEMHDIIGVTLGQDISICEGESVTLEPKSFKPVSSYYWNTGSTNSTLTVSEHGTYSVSVSDGTCTDITDVNVFVLEYPIIDLGADTSVCPGSLIAFDATQDAEVIEYSWFEGGSQSTQEYVAEKNMSIWVAVSNADCRSYDTINIDIISSPSAYIGEDTAICSGDQLNIDVSEDARIQTVNWSTGASGLSATITDSGTYSVVVFDGNCQTKDKVRINLKPEPTQADVFIDVPDVICLNESFDVDIKNELISGYQWQDGSTKSTYTIDSEGIYWIKASHACGVLVDTAEVSRCECPIWVPTAFNPDGNTVNDQFAPKLDCEPLEYMFRIYDRWGELVYETNKPFESWDGQYHGTDAAMGAYAWKLVFTVYHEGSIMKSEKSGSILLIR